jgi:hypothetical protein
MATLPTEAKHDTGGTSTPLVKEDPDFPSPSSALSRLSQRLNTDVDPKQCISISIYACFLTGFTSSPSFSVGDHNRPN